MAFALHSAFSCRSSLNTAEWYNTAGGYKSRPGSWKKGVKKRLVWRRRSSFPPDSVNNIICIEFVRINMNECICTRSYAEAAPKWRSELRRGHVPSFLDRCPLGCLLYASGRVSCKSQRLLFLASDAMQSVVLLWQVVCLSACLWR